MRSDEVDVDDILDVLARASIGDLTARVDVDQSNLEEPLPLIANTINVLLGDLEYRQREREEAVAQAARATAKEELLAYFSHEMKTPLAVINGYLDLLLDSRHPTSEDAHAQIMTVITRHARLLQRLIEQFLEVGRLESGLGVDVVLEPVEVGEAVAEAVTLFPDGERVRIDLPDRLPAVRADAERVVHILMNLLSNALKYAGSEDEVIVRARHDATAVRIEVVDRGVGISRADLERIFDKFYRAGDQAPRQGSGLGLYLSRALAEAQGGSLEARSSPGAGATFTLTLPVARSHEADAASSPGARSGRHRLEHGE